MGLPKNCLAVTISELRTRRPAVTLAKMEKVQLMVSKLQNQTQKIVLKRKKRLKLKVVYERG